MKLNTQPQVTNPTITHSLGVVEFWESLFKDFEIVPFPLIDDRREMQSSHEEIGTFEVDLTKFDHIKEIFDVSQYAIMQTIWTLVVYYFQRSDHIAFGSATNDLETELTTIQHRIGMKINTSPVPVRLTPSTKISDIMKYLDDFHDQSISHLQPNFTLLRKWIHHQSNEIFFDTALNYIRQGSEIESLPIQTTLSGTMSDVEFPLSMTIVESPDSLTWRVSYDPKAITLDTIKRISNTFQNVMDMILSGENHTVVDMCALPREEFSILERFGTGLRVDMLYDCAHHPFEEIARNRSDLIAVEHEDRSITYGELNERAEEIACLLMNRGIQVGDYVGLVTTRSIEMVYGIFGILKAGGAYIPIDHELPLERIQYMLDLADCSTILYHPDIRQEVFDGLDLSNSVSLVETTPNNHFIAPVIGGDSPAYVVFTSGSTGKPKGVTVSHRSLMNYCMTNPSGLGVCLGDRVAQLASIGFDISVKEVFISLSHCATLCLRTENDYFAVLKTSLVLPVQ
ncbi:hypothetical protein BC833DRAFT_647151 [Globomyces pollinis-pini]|nr:hypothetical protein BC833DRAFT_647151 [Globomyces pollinis-pini]